MNGDTLTPVDALRFPLSFTDGARPTWELALFFPQQGSWRKEEYLSLESHFDGGFRAELADGVLEVLPVPTEEHQDIALYLYEMLKAWAKTHDLGKVSFSGIRVLVANGDRPRFREPDVVFMRKQHAQRRHSDYWEGADLAMEVVSEDPKDQTRDYQTKVADYAAAGIPEYWIVDPFERRIRVLVLQGDAYHLHGDFHPDEFAASVLLPGFTVAVTTVLAGGAEA